MNTTIECWRLELVWALNFSLNEFLIVWTEFAQKEYFRSKTKKSEYQH